MVPGAVRRNDQRDADRRIQLRARGRGRHLAAILQHPVHRARRRSREVRVLVQDAAGKTRPGLPLGVRAAAALVRGHLHAARGSRVAEEGAADGMAPAAGQIARVAGGSTQALRRPSAGHSLTGRPTSYQPTDRNEGVVMNRIARIAAAAVAAAWPAAILCGPAGAQTFPWQGLGNPNVLVDYV